MLTIYVFYDNKIYKLYFLYSVTAVSKIFIRSYVHSTNCQIFINSGMNDAAKHNLKYLFLYSM
jgi:hypothetical protein